MNASKRVTVIDCGSLKAKDLAAILAKCTCRVDIITLADASRHSFGDRDAVVISGGPLLLTLPDTAEALAGKFDFIPQLEIPCLGICLGHQAIGLQYGSRIYLGEERRAEEQIRIETDHPLFAGFPKIATLREDHCEGIELADGFERLASSDAYPVEAMADDNRRLYGVQFHPEVSGALGERLLENFVTRLSSDSRP